MNHNIIENLALKAGLVRGHLANADNVRIWKELSDNPGALNRFAELIIQKCRNVITDFDGVENYEYIMNPRSVRRDCDCEIRDYFGLEE